MQNNTTNKSSDKLSGIFVILVFLFSLGGLLWLGQNKIKESTNINSTIIKWQTLDNSFQYDSFLITIVNREKQKNAYHLQFFLDQEKIDEKDIILKVTEEKTLGPAWAIIKQKVADLISAKKVSEKNSANQEFCFLYQVKISWSNREEILGKYFCLEK